LWRALARRAAARIVDTLTPADRFSVLCFDNVVERMPGAADRLAEASDRNRFRAIEWLARTPARGGTVILEPLEQAVRLLTDETKGARPADRDRVLVLVTDGQVGNEDQILQRIGARLAGIRVHVVGIDRAVNAGFLGADDSCRLNLVLDEPLASAPEYAMSLNAAFGGANTALVATPAA